jgi:hypothetical protein
LINWISKIVKEISRDLLIKSFDVCGITQNNEIHYHTALRHILTKEDLPVTKLNELDGTEDLSEIFVDEDDEYAESEDGDETDDKWVRG